MPDDDNAGFDTQLPDLTGLPLDQLPTHPALRRAAERVRDETPETPVAAFQSAI